MTLNPDDALRAVVAQQMTFLSTRATPPTPLEGKQLEAFRAGWPIKCTECGCYGDSKRPRCDCKCHE